MSTIIPIFSEGFDNVSNTSQLVGKWDVPQSSPVNNSSGRYGTNGIAPNQSMFGMEKWFTVNYTAFLESKGMRWTNVNSGDQHVMYWIDGATPQLSLYLSPTTGVFQVLRGGNLAQVVASVDTVTNLVDSTYRHYMMKARIGGATGDPATYGYVKVWLNTALILDATNVNTQQTANSYINKVATHKLLTNQTPPNFDDIVMCSVSGAVDNDHIGDVRVPYRTVVGAGAQTDWSRNTGAANWQALDEIPANGDTDYVYSSTAGQIDLYTLADLGIASGTILGVQPQGNLRKDDAGVREFAFMLRSGGVNAQGVTKQALDSYRYFCQMFAVDPTDNAAWDIARVDALEIGQKLVT